LAERVDAFEPSPAATFGELKLTESSSTQELTKAVKKRFAEVPAGFIEPETLLPRLEEMVKQERAQETLQAAALPSNIWDCLVRKLGWWAAIGIAAVLAAGLVALSLSTAAGGPLGTAAAWTLFYWLMGISLGAWTLTVVGNCILNPRW
jgi:hypothetical protein